MGPARTGSRPQRSSGTRSRPGTLSTRRPDEAICSACGASIRWCITARNGKPVPLDYEPNADGNTRLRADWRQTKFGISQVCEVVPVEEQLVLGMDPLARYMPHFATCPYAERFKGKAS